MHARHGTILPPLERMALKCHRAVLHQRSTSQSLGRCSRSSAGAEAYPGDRAFSDSSCTTIQIHTLRIEEEATGDVLADRVPAVAVHLLQQEHVLIHDE